jgi:tetratricopeptide (TPR) repeat protein
MLREYRQNLPDRTRSAEKRGSRQVLFAGAKSIDETCITGDDMPARPRNVLLILLLPSLWFISVGQSFAQVRTSDREDLKRQADDAYRAGDFQKTINLTDQVLRVAPTDDVALYLRGSAKVELGTQQADAKLIRDGIADARSAIEHTRRAEIDYYLPYLYGMSHLAAIEGRESHLTTAIDVAGQLIDMPRWTDAERANIYYQRALMREQKQNEVAADEDFQNAIRLDPSHVAAHLERANLLARTAGPDEAEAAFDRAVQAFPDNAVVVNNRGMFYQSQGRLDDALADFDRAVKIDGKFAAGYTNRGYALLEADRPTEAIESFDAALQISEKQPMVWGLRGTARLSLGELQQAVDDYQQAIDLQPDNPASHADLGFALFFEKEHQKSISEFQEAQRLDTEAKFLNGWLTAAWLALNQRTTAESKFADILNKPSSERNWFDMIVLFELGRVSDNELLAAVATGDKKLQTAQQCEAYYFIGLAKQRAGDEQDAALYFRQALQTGASHLSGYRGAQFELNEFRHGPSA